MSLIGEALSSDTIQPPLIKFKVVHLNDRQSGDVRASERERISGANMAKDHHGILGLLVSLKLFGDDQGDLGDLSDMMTFGHDEGEDSGAVVANIPPSLHKFP
jgi:hypothetical protein